MPSEATLRKSCTALIRARGGWARTVPQGIHSAGMADVVFFYRGYGGLLETKLPGRESTLTKLQAETLRQAKAAGAIAEVITSKKQVAELLDKIDRVRDKR